MISIGYEFELNPEPEEINEETTPAEIAIDRTSIAVWLAIGLVLIAPLVMVCLG